MSLIAKLILSVSLLALAACSTSPRIGTDYDPEHDFGHIQSYHILDKKRATGDLINARIVHAVNNSMTSRGITLANAEEADILIDFMVVAKDKTRVTSYNTGYGYHGYGYGRGYGYGYGGNSVDVRQYTEGTLLLDLIDPKENRTVWRGTVSAVVKQRSVEEKTEIANSYTEAIIAEMPL